MKLKARDFASSAALVAALIVFVTAAALGILDWVFNAIVVASIVVLYSVIFLVAKQPPVQPRYPLLFLLSSAVLILLYAFRIASFLAAHQPLYVITDLVILPGLVILNAYKLGMLSKARPGP